VVEVEDGMGSLVRVDWRIAGRDLGFLSPSHAPAAPPVLLLRGFDLRADWAFYPYLIERLAEKRPVWLVPPEPARSLIEELDFAEGVLRAWGQGQRPPGYAAVRGAMGLLGHGKGATLALLAASVGLPVQGVVGLAPLATLNRAFPPAELAHDAHRLFVERAVRSLNLPVALIHGEEDHVVPPAEGEQLYHWLPKETGRLIMLEKTGHSFGARDPFASTSKELEIVVRVSCDFFR
jgi:pimeloyl-ACP methyl ester carboxylesterase